MWLKLLTFAFCNILLVSCSVLDNEVKEVKKYDPNWESLDSRPLPEWFDNAKIGIFLHWGLYSVPNMGTEWFWWWWKGTNTPAYVEYMKKNYPPDFTYQDFGKEFTAELFDPNHWAELFRASGAKYVVLTSKHHDGYSLWPSKYSFSWNSQDVGAHRDLVGELAEAIRNKTDLKFGLYHSLFEWFNRLYREDESTNFTSKNFVNTKTLPQLYELIHTYKPSVLWSDGEVDASEYYWNSLEFLAWLYNESPVKDEIVTNDRWGTDTHCKHGGFFSCSDRYNPGTLQPHKWENAMTIDKASWGYRRDAKLSDYMTQKELVKQVIQTVSCGGNILINIGPTKEGIIDVIFEERLRNLGAWLNVNGKAIYKTQPWEHQNDTLTSDVWFTTEKEENSTTVFTLFYNWPSNDKLELGALPQYMESTGTVTMIGTSGTLTWNKTDTSVVISLPAKVPVADAWVLEIKLK